MKECFKITDKIKRIDIKILDLVWFLGMPILNLNYFLAGKIAKRGHDITISLDNIVPFSPIFVFPYVYWLIYSVIGLILILIKTRKDYIRAFLSIFIGMCICYFVYYIFPTEIDRPIINNSDFINRLINFIYYVDKPFNCFPSLHVLKTYFIMRYTKREYSRIGFYYTQIVGVLIILSTILIKQHFIVDIFSAIILCEIIIYFVKKIDDNIINEILELPYKVKESIKKYSINFWN